MKALLLAAGLGTRLQPITNQIPKCLVPIHKKPLLEYWLELLFLGKIEHVLINTHYMADKVKEYTERSPWRNAITLVNENVLLGTAGTLYKNRNFLKRDSFLLAHADNLTRFDVTEFVATHNQRQSDIAITMMTFDTDTPESCGIVEVDKHNVVREFYEKSSVQRGTRANAAVYIMEPAVIDFIASLNKKVVDLSTEVLPHFMGRIQVYHNSNYHRDIGTPESLHLAEMEF